MGISVDTVNRRLVDFMNIWYHQCERIDINIEFSFGGNRQCEGFVFVGESSLSHCALPLKNMIVIAVQF